MALFRSLALAAGLLLLAGPVAALTYSAHDAPKEVPRLTMLDHNNQVVGLDSFEGKVVVLNLWGTWCAGCKREMPSLDRLQASLGDQGVVIALAVDRASWEKVDVFMDETGAKELTVLRDPTIEAWRTLAPKGFPATLIIDKNGREVGRALGLAEWDSEEVLEILKPLLAE